MYAFWGLLLALQSTSAWRQWAIEGSLFGKSDLPTIQRDLGLGAGPRLIGRIVLSVPASLYPRTSSLAYQPGHPASPASSASQTITSSRHELVWLTTQPMRVRGGSSPCSDFRPHWCILHACIARVCAHPMHSAQPFVQSAICRSRPAWRLRSRRRLLQAGWVFRGRAAAPPPPPSTSVSRIARCGEERLRAGTCLAYSSHQSSLVQQIYQHYGQ